MIRRKTSVKRRLLSKRKIVLCENLESLQFYSNIKLNKYCWVFTGYKDRDGYGTIGDENGISKQAHRISYSIFKGDDIPDGKIVCHYCDNPSCFNPNHLFLGSHKDNNKDRKLKGRSATGDRNGMYTKPNTRSYNNEYHAKVWLIIKEDGSSIEIKNLFKYCKENDINYYNLQAQSGCDKFYKGFKCIRK